MIDWEKQFLLEVSISRRQLQESGLTAEEIAQFTNSEMTWMASMMAQNYREGLFIEDVRHLSQVILREKEGNMSEIGFWSKEFVITSITRADIVAAGFSKDFVATITDAQMQQIASQMEDVYCDDSYWDDVNGAVEHVLPHAVVPTGDDDEQEPVR